MVKKKFLNLKKRFVSTVSWNFQNAIKSFHLRLNTAETAVLIFQQVSGRNISVSNKILKIPFRVVSFELARSQQQQKKVIDLLRKSANAK